MDRPKVSVSVQRPSTSSDGGVTFTNVVVQMNPDDFKIDENNIDAELSNLGVQLYEYGQLYAELKGELARKEDRSKQTYAIRAQFFRNASVGVTPRMTDANLKEQVECDKDYQTAQENLQLTRLYCLMAENWWRSMQQKSDLVKALCYKQKAEIQKY